MRKQAKECSFFALGNQLYIRLGLYSPNDEKEDYSACMLRKAEQTRLRL